MRRRRVLPIILMGGTLAVCVGDCVVSPGKGPGQEIISHEPQAEGGTMTFDDKRFEEVKLNSLGPSPCSPEAPADRSFRGIIIAAPGVISFSPGRISGLSIPVCGFLRQEALRMPEGGAGAMYLVVVNRETGDQYGGYPVFSDMAEPLPPDENPLKPEELRGIVIGVYFNFDLMEVVRLPRKNGIYDAWLTLGAEDSQNHLCSNHVAFRLLQKNED